LANYRFKVQIETRQNHEFSKVVQQLNKPQLPNVGTLVKLSNEQLKVVEDYFELKKERLWRRMDAKGLQVVDRDTVDPHIAAALETLKKERESRELLTGRWN
jgi:hypothetical protein